MLPRSPPERAYPISKHPGRSSHRSLRRFRCLPLFVSPRCKRRAVGRRFFEAGLPIRAMYKCFPAGSRTYYRNTGFRCQGSAKVARLVGPLYCLGSLGPRRAVHFRLAFGPGPRRRAERFDVANQLPALGFRQFGPNGHPLTDDPVGQKPEKSARGGAFDWIDTQARASFTAIRRLAVAVGAVLPEQLFTRGHRLRIVLQWIASRRGLRRSLSQFSVN